jgi:hypothetical protein
MVKKQEGNHTWMVVSRHSSYTLRGKFYEPKGTTYGDGQD